jgi:hypothetical protein
MGIAYLDKPKQPWEALPRYVDFVDRIAAADTIASCTIAATDSAGTDVTATIIEGPTSYSAAKVYYTLKAGTDGMTYKVTFRATSTAGSLVEEDLIVEVRQL